MKTGQIKYYISIGIIISYLISGCEKSEDHSDIPEISFQKLVVDDVMDTLGTVSKTASLTFAFIDGDGDIGSKYFLKESQIFFTWYRKNTDGSYQSYKFADGTVQDSLDIPYREVMDRDEAQNKLLKGWITIHIPAPAFTPAGMDTVRIEYYITDRARHKSNIIYTPDFSILDDYVEIGEDPDIPKK